MPSIVDLELEELQKDLEKKVKEFHAYKDGEKGITDKYKEILDAVKKIGNFLQKRSKK